MKTSAIMIVLLFPLLLLAQQTVQGNISADARWSGEILVKGDVTVPKGVTLSIDPGTRVIIDANSDATGSGKDAKHIEIFILGKLMAEGSGSEGQIIFTSNAPEPRMYDWYGIIIKNINEPSLLKHCVIEYAYKGITCYGSSPEITACEIRYNQYAGISSEVRSNPVVRNSTLSGNDFAGLLCELASNPVVEKNVITQNLNGIVVFDRSNPDIGSATPAEGGSSGENLILNNFESNIYNHSVNDIYAQNNLWNASAEPQIQETVFDNAQNPSKGKVVFMPVFGGSFSAQRTLVQRTIQESEPVKQTTDQGSNSAVQASVPLAQANNSVSGKTTPEALKPAKPENQTPKNNTPGPDSSQYFAAANAAAGAALIKTPDQTPIPTPAVVQPETLYVYKEVPVEKPVEPEPEVAEPVIEALLDNGRREYVQRANAEYPNIYRKTSHEGKVLVEVTVARNGDVEEYRVLRSDGDLFTNAAIDAIKKFKYKPGTFKGKPVKFKIVEPFLFRLNQ